MGVVVEGAGSVLGLDDHGFRTVMQRTQPEGARSGPDDTDRTLHSLRRFVRLAASGNPSILMALWAPVLHSTPAGEELRALADAFVGVTSSPGTGGTCRRRRSGFSASVAEVMVAVAGEDERS